jgi:hypothetical protein
MRPNQNSSNKNRSRGRNNNGGRKHVNPLSRNFESNGPDVKVRGNAAHVAEKYVQLARDAQASGDSVMAENYFQHAEHYFRILSAAQAQGMPRPEPFGADSDADDYEAEDAVEAAPEPFGRLSPEPQQADGQRGERQDRQDRQDQRQDQRHDRHEQRAETGEREERGERRERRPDRPRRERQQAQPVAAEPAAAAAPAVLPPPQPVAVASVAEPVAEPAPAALPEGAAEAEAPRPRRTRRRTVRADGPDPASAPQPDLPGFITGGGQSAAE